MLLASVVVLAGAHAAMIGVMVMTPLHMEHGGAELRIIGVVISVHVLGMFAFSPLVGMMADRLGRPPVAMLGATLLLAALTLCASSPEGTSWQVFVGLFLLGLGWSCATVAGSTMVTDHAPLESRTDVQGLTDLVMNLVAAGRRRRLRVGRRVVGLPGPVAADLPAAGGGRRGGVRRGAAHESGRARHLLSVSIPPVDELARRVAVAETMAPAYAANDGVAAVLLAGSVARGLADGRSDVEVDVYWHRPPTDEERRAVVDDAGWEWVYAEVDEHEWADGVRLDGVKVDVSQFTTATIDGYLAALRTGDTEPELQVRATALEDGRALAGHERIEAWRRRLAPYPEPLGLAMLDDALPPRPVERLEMLRDRDDPVLLTRDLVEGVHGLLDALFAVNRRYVPHPFHKWLAFECSRLVLAPRDLEARIRAVLAAPMAGVPDFVRLTHETLDLVEEHVPAYDVATARADFGTSLRG